MGKFSRAEITRERWIRGRLGYKLHAGQKKIDDAVAASKNQLFVGEIARQFGKSYWLVIKAIEKAIRTPKGRIKYGTAFHTDLIEFILPTFDMVLEDCPEDLRPVWKSQQSKWVFKNGAEIKLVGLDRKPNGLRGNKIDMIILDECGFMSRLDYLYKSVIIPATTHRPDCRILLFSTPPETPDHEFLELVEKAQYEGGYLLLTIYDNPLVDQKTIDRLMHESGGAESTTWRREYLCIEGSSLVTVKLPSGEIKSLTIKELKRELSQGKGTYKNGPFKIPKSKEWIEKQRVALKKTMAPSINAKGYQILTPTGFQDFDGVAYSGLVEVLCFELEDGTQIKVSKKHRFDASRRIAKDYKIGDVLLTERGFSKIASICSGGKKQVFDVLDVKGDHLYFANGIANHNCEHITDAARQIVASWKDEYVQDYPRSPEWKFYHLYVAMDLGVEDFTTVLFAYYDFKAAKLIVEDEWFFNGPTLTTKKISEAIRAKEAELFEGRSPYRRVSDNNNPLLLQDLSLDPVNPVHFMATDKGTLEEMVNTVKIMVQVGRIIVHPRCKQVWGCLKNGIWDKRRQKFAKSKVYGHYDALAALIYLVRNLDQATNPIPHNYLFDPDNQILFKPKDSQDVINLRDGFGLRGRRR